MHCSKKRTTAVMSAILLVALILSPQSEVRSQAEEEPHHDQFGDPLPAGAVARMGTARLRHGSSVYFVAFVADGKQVLSAGEDGLARLWNVASGKEVRRFGASEPAAADSGPLIVGLAPDGKTLATCGGDGLVSLWDTTTGRPTHQLKGLKAALRAEVAAIQVKGMHAISPDVAALALSPDGKTMAAAGVFGPILLWDVAGDKEIRRFAGLAGADLDPKLLHPDVPADERKQLVKEFRASVLLSMAQDFRRPNGPAGAGQGIWSQKERPDLGFSADGKVLLSATFGMKQGMKGVNTDTAVEVWNVATGKRLVRVEPGDQRRAVSAALSPDGRTVAWADQTPTDGGNIHVMDVATGKELRRFAVDGVIDHLTPPNAKIRRKSIGVGTRFTFAPDGRTLVTRAVRGQVVVWDLASGKEVRRLGKVLPPPTSWYGISFLSPPGLAISPNGKTLAVAGDGNAVTLMSLETGQELQAPGHHAAITAVRYTQDGKGLTSIAGDGSVCTWDAATGKETSLARAADGMLTSVLSADGRMVAGAGLDGKVRLKDAATGKERATILTSLQGALRLAFAPDGKTLAVGTSGSSTVRLYDIGTQKEIRDLKPPEDKDHKSGPMIVPFRAAPPPVFSSDGKLLAAPGRSVLHIWDAIKGEESRRLALPPDRSVGAAVFAPDGRSVAIDMQDGTVAVWDLTTGKRTRVYESGPLSVPERPPAGPAGVSLLGPVDPALLAFSPDGLVLVHSRGLEVAVWDVGSGRRLGLLKGHGGAVLAGDFAADSKSLATASGDTTVLVWDVATLKRGVPKDPD